MIFPRRAESASATELMRRLYTTYGKLYGEMPPVGVLHVIGGHDRGKRFDLTLPETRIGRGADQDVVLSDIAVSRRHITVLMEGARFRLRDLGSGNGTLVNGQRIDTVLLNDGDHIELGNTVLRFNQQN